MSNQRNGEIMVEAFSTMISPNLFVFRPKLNLFFLETCPPRSAGMQPCHEIRNQFTLGICSECNQHCWKVVCVRVRGVGGGGGGGGVFVVCAA